MSLSSPRSVRITKEQARRIWLTAQRLDRMSPFGGGPEAVRAAVEHLGYVQIDTINVIERCHHHILWNRVPDYRREHLHQAQTIDRSVFEYWTHALAYVPARDIRFFLPLMRRHRDQPDKSFASVTKVDLNKVLTRIRKQGPISIRDIDDDVLVEKDHLWASRKPSKRALQFLFYAGVLTISERLGMVKTYDLTERHLGWVKRPAPATERQIVAYKLDRALRAQGLVSLDSVCHLDASSKPAVLELIEARVRARRLVPLIIEGVERVAHWAEPAMLAISDRVGEGLVHILSPFDPLIIQRRRLKLLFDYEHLFEAYVPKDKRVFGYFALPVLAGSEIVAVLDLKTDREKRELRIQQWSWAGRGTPGQHKTHIEEALDRFESFQLSGSHGTEMDIASEAGIEQPMRTIAQDSSATIR